MRDAAPDGPWELKVGEEEMVTEMLGGVRRRGGVAEDGASAFEAGVGVCPKDWNDKVKIHDQALLSSVGVEGSGRCDAIREVPGEEGVEGRPIVVGVGRQARGVGTRVVSPPVAKTTFSETEVARSRRSGWHERATGSRMAWLQARFRLRSSKPQMMLSSACHCDGDRGGEGGLGPWVRRVGSW